MPTSPSLAHSARALALGLSLVPALVAQDECINAVPVTLGSNGPFTNFGATTSLPAWTCPTSGGNDVWYSYTATQGGNLTVSLCGANYDSAIEAFDGSAGCGALSFLVCNDDFCAVDSQITFPVFPGNTYYIRVGGFGAATGNFPLDLSLNLGFGIAGTSEALPNTGTLSPGGGFFRDGDFLRWNYTDPFGNFSGGFAAIVMNFGLAGSAPTGVTAAIPGFQQLWSGSTPAGVGEVFAPVQVGGPDFFVFVPPGLFTIGDTVRIQGLVLSNFATGALPVVPSFNTIQWENSLCSVGESFEGLTGVGNYPAGWSNGGGTWEWQGDSGGTPSAGTGPSMATNGSTYFYCEASSPTALGDTFILNSAIYASSSLVGSTMSFDLSRVGANMGTLEVRMDDGSGTFATLLGTYSGPEPTGLEWTPESFALPTPLPANIQFQFFYTAGSPFTGDIAIDNFCLL